MQRHSTTWLLLLTLCCAVGAMDWYSTYMHNDGNIIGKAYKGEQYEISTFNGEWAKITLSDGKQGWAYMGYLELVGAGSGE